MDIINLPASSYTVPLATGVSGTLPVANGGTNYTGGAFTSYSPTITVLNGSAGTTTITGAYLQIGKIVFFNQVIVWGGVVTTTGFWTDLPVTARGTSKFYGVGTGIDTSGALVSGITVTSMAGCNYYNTALGANFAPTTGHTTTMNGFYEAA